MKKTMFLLLSSLITASLFAAPAAKGGNFEPVAEGYCAWSGLTEANYLLGRWLCPSDMRHRLAAVVFIDAKDWEAQMRKVDAGISSYNPNSSALGESAETSVIPHGALALVVLVGKDLPAAADIKKFLSKNREDLKCANWYIYANVSGSKVPDHGGKFPFYCVFGPEPGDPIASGAYDAAAAKKLAALKRNKKYALANWKPYFGTVEEPKAVKGFVKRLAKPPLDSLSADCRKGISGKDPEKAKECQILYDALEQTRSDYLFSVMSFASSCPTRAIWDAQIVMKQWPKAKKTLKPLIDRAKAIPDVDQLCKMFAVVKTYGAEDFKCKNAGDAKKKEAELMKIKATCDNLVQKSKNNVVQGAAAWIANEAETLAPQMAGKVPTK